MIECSIFKLNVIYIYVTMVILLNLDYFC